MTSRVRVACVQLTAARDIAPNIEAARQLIRAAASAGAQFVLTPENTTMMEPDRALLREKLYREADHPAVPAFSDLARECGIWLLIGSMGVLAEAEDGEDGVSAPRAANRSLLFSPEGEIVARYDKIHMFDVSVPDGQSYRESANYRAGSTAVVAKLPWADLGLSICYDLRFPQLYRALARGGAGFLSVPAAFTRFTGQAHWHLLLRARAVETGCFVFAPAQCGTHAEGRQTYGHSLIVSPWGEVMADAGEQPGYVMVEVDTGRVHEARRMIPSLENDRAFSLTTEALRAV